MSAISVRHNNKLRHYTLSRRTDRRTSPGHLLPDIHSSSNIRHHHHLYGPVPCLHHHPLPVPAQQAPSGAYGLCLLHVVSDTPHNQSPWSPLVSCGCPGGSDQSCPFGRLPGTNEAGCFEISAWSMSGEPRQRIPWVEVGGGGSVFSGSLTAQKARNVVLRHIVTKEYTVSRTACGQDGIGLGGI